MPETLTGTPTEALIEARLRLGYAGTRAAGFTLDVDLALPARGVSAIFGPSGSGKTTLLRCIAGLERPRGRLVVKGEVWQDDDVFLPPHRRPIGYVFQDANLFPHLDVAGNLDYGARRAGKAGEGTRSRAAVVELLGIGHLLSRGVGGLSGGERQRVAIARALLARPRLLLLDEPLAALERGRKREILPYLERLRDELDLPMLYVSHALNEVRRLADHLVLMDEGRAVASGPLAELASRLDLPLAREEDAGVVIGATVGAYDERHHLTRLDFPGGSLFAALEGGGKRTAGAPLGVSVRARDVSIALSNETDSSILNRLPALIESFGPAAHPAQLLVRLDAGGTAILARISAKSREELHLKEGQRVWAQIKSVALAE